ncbi:MAG: ceramidase domain-containing protein [Gammaproteobacteria bacterium]
MRDSINHYWLIAICLICVATALLLEPIAQDPAYHLFADERTLLGVTNFWNVISNLAFVLSGLLGLKLCWQTRRRIPGVSEIGLAYPGFFLGILLTGFGSVYYHLAPDTSTLTWDRLPMTLAFMSFFIIVLAEHISVRTARMLLWPLLLAGVLSVLYWHYTEIRQQGDMRAYILVQFLPVLLTPLILLLFNSRYTHSAYFWGMFGLYLAAKVAEHHDHTIFEFTGFSGHSLKHLLAGGGALVFYLMLAQRRAAFTAEMATRSEANPVADSLPG